MEYFKSNLRHIVALPRQCAVLLHTGHATLRLFEQATHAFMCMSGPPFG